MHWKALCLVPLVLLGLAACSIASASAGAGQPTSLHVTRTEALPGYNFALLDTTIQDAAAVQQLYQAAYALPHPASGTYNCPNDIELVYHLEFFQGGSSVQQMSLNATGCQFLRIGQDDVRMSNDAFNDSLAKALGIPALVPPIPGKDQHTPTP